MLREVVDVSPPVADRARGGRALLRRVLSTLVLAPAFVWLVLAGPAWLFAALIVVVAALAQWELSRMFERAGVRTVPLVGVPLGVLLTASFLVPAAVPGVLTLAIAVALAAGLTGAAGPLPAWEPVALTLLGLGAVSWMAGHVLWLHALPAGREWILLLVWITWIGETGAYVVGSTLGRHRLAPVVSPRKTVEGAVAQLVLSPAAALAARGWLAPDLSGWEVLGLGLALGVVGQVGDLVESLLKRSVGAKDASRLIPGHGGVLDRIDGLLWNAPALYYYAAWSRGLHP